MPQAKPTSSNSKRLTHFLCIPLVTPTSRPQLQASLSRFRNDLSGSSGGSKPSSNNGHPDDPSSGIATETSVPPRIPPKAIRPVGTIHLTVGVMSLATPEKVQIAVDVLKSVDLRALLRDRNNKDSSGSRSRDRGSGGGDGTGRRVDISGTQGIGGERNGMSESEYKTGDTADELRVTLKGVSSMSDPNRTSILYTAPADGDGQLLRFCLGLRDIFIAADLVVPETRPLLLHATVLNTIYVPGIKRAAGGRNGRGGRNGKEKLTLDAREILDRYRDTEWMSNVKIEKVAICKMGARKVEGSEEGDEEYVVESEIEMP